MVKLEPTPIMTRPWPVRQAVKGSALARLLRTTDAKQIGLLYLVTSMRFFFARGLMAMLMRAELARPGLQLLSLEQYNQLFTMHGTIMLLLIATPIVFAFANYIVPLQIGAPDVSFPRLNALAYWPNSPHNVVEPRSEEAGGAGDEAIDIPDETTAPVPDIPAA